MQIVRLIEQPDRENLLPAIDAVFFEASSIKTFADEGARASFRHRWLGLYLDIWPEFVLLAREATSAGVGGAVAGYLVGCPTDPAMDRRFDDIGYFRSFAAACAAYPAHLHINLAPGYRGRGIGGALVDAFAAQAHRAGASGVHIVTSKDARNVRFYRSCRFDVIDEAPWRAGAVVFMGRRLDSPA